VLLAVVRDGPIRLSELADAESLNPTMLSRVIADLGDAGLLARVSDDGDRRAAWVKATAAGKRLAERMRRERTDALNQALEGLSLADRRQLEQALPALEGLAEQLKGRRP
jgi:DNA-binding MarR family transcriptional regulator